jgi:hypothetical protein
VNLSKSCSSKWSFASSAILRTSDWPIFTVCLRGDEIASRAFQQPFS